MDGHGQKLFTRTQHYRKVTKPLLERKRRARMNLYLDELKDIIVDAMEAQGEHVAKLEKADILEMTVTYLRARVQAKQAASIQGLSLLDQKNEQGNTIKSSGAKYNHWNAEKFQAGYAQATLEVSRIFAGLPELDAELKTGLFECVRAQLENVKHVDPIPTLSIERKADHRVSEIKANHRHCASQQPTATDDVWRPW